MAREDDNTVRVSEPDKPTKPDFSEEELALLLANIDNYTLEEQAEIYELLEELDQRASAEAARDDLIAFCQYMQDDYIVGKHHRRLADLLMLIESGEPTEHTQYAKNLTESSDNPEPIKKPLDRLCVNIAPRHGKSMLISTYYPAWFLGRNPDKKVMLVSHTTDLAVDFGRKVRNLIASTKYKEIFGNVSLSHDSKSAGRWNTDHGGEFFACGVGSALAGRGADLLLVDDPHSEQDVLAGNFDVFDKAYDWFTYGARTRLMPGGRIAIVQTRWHQDDLTGRVVQDMRHNTLADQYEVVEFPAILEIPTEVEEEIIDPRGIKRTQKTTKIVEKPLWPEWFDLDALQRTRNSMPLFQWNAQYQQNPTAEEAAIVKREWWKTWKHEKPPKCEYLIMTLDAAAETKTRADFTALTTWGVFMNEETNQYELILLNSIKKRVEFPELKVLAYEEFKEWEPDAFIVEKKSSGTALYQELRRIGILIQEYTPHRGTGDKVARLNSVADIIKSGICWVPETRWAEEVVEEIAAFPFAKHDDLVDATIMALLRFRQGGFLRLPTDYEDEEPMYRRTRRGYY